MIKILLILFSLLMVSERSAYPMQYVGRELAEGASKLFAVSAFLDTLQAAAEETGHVLALDCEEAVTDAALYRRLQRALEECRWEWVFCWEKASLDISRVRSANGRLALENFYEDLLINAGIFLKRKDETGGIEQALEAQTGFWALLLNASTVKLCRDLYRNSFGSVGPEQRQTLLKDWQGNSFLRIEQWRSDVDMAQVDGEEDVLSPLLDRQVRNRTPLSDAPFGEEYDCEGEQE